MVLSADGGVEGMRTDGDVRRWLTRADGIDVNVPVSRVCNTEFLAPSDLALARLRFDAIMPTGLRATLAA